MKKSSLIITTFALASFAFGGAKVQAEVSSTHTSENKINFTAGEGVVTPPVDPTNPDNPNVPNPVDPTDPTNPGTGQTGPLSIDYVSNIKFGEHKITGKDIAYKAKNANPFIQVTDLRGAGEGWHLSAKMSEFKSRNKVLRGATLAFKDGVVKAGSKSNISLAPTKSDVLFDNDEGKPFMSAKDKGGRGTWLTVWSGADQANEAIQLNVVAGTPEANTEYTSSITWELADAPK
ncbi:WxL domain-containing protein [Carnobacterium maltaromaticum]|uniref:WxL domain-containing protein n=1 Tax=Carnobacterium maltaromaticum TaxID=2751 RepID=UPI00298B6110|nr:WxL domain-containing protein [Carnobacterium maltaromaticum]MDW5525552.1 WxL domain-containing protein [Carnobacterium maltaromaticum]